MIINIIMSFKSGKFKGKSFDNIIDENGTDLNKLKKSKHIAYKKFNTYYKQKSPQINNFPPTILRKNKLSENLFKII